MTTRSDSSLASRVPVGNVRCDEGGAWSASKVIALARHPCNVRMYADAPYIKELFRDDAAERVRHPASPGALEVAPPLRLSSDAKPYYLPGSARDLLLHTSCMLAVSADVGRFLDPGSDRHDLAPPSRSDLMSGSFGEEATMVAAWSRVSEATTRALTHGYTHVLLADVRQCIANIRADRVTRLLRRAGADADAVCVLERLHEAWHAAGCRGIPLTAGFRILIKPYLKRADDALADAGVAFVRLQDDFRVFCRGETEVRERLATLTDVVSACGFELNDAKTLVLSRRQLRWAPKPRWMRLRHKLADGVLRPLLSDALQHTPVRDLAGSALLGLYSRRWEPIAPRALV
ncbi:MAG: hypothetical protein MJB57_05895 [Gemmatimonadetes bacterium]|nr:hypothetical protein [Gemmatimonadota bacterium]